MFCLLLVLCRDMYENGQTEVDYWSRLDLASFTLFQIATSDSYSDVLREMQATYSWSWIPILIYLTLTGIVIANIVIAIICDSVLGMGREIELEEEETQLKKKMKTMQTDITTMLDEITWKLGLDDSFNGRLGPSSSSDLHISRTTSNLLPHEHQDSAIPNTSLDNDDDEKRRTLSNMPSIQRVQQAEGYPQSFCGKCGKFVNSRPVQAFIMILIIVNSIMMAIGTFKFVTDDPSVLYAFDTADAVFLSIYTVESVLQVIYHGRRIYQDKWSSFDLVLVLISWIFSFASSIPVQAARSLRIIRILCLIPKLESMKIIITAVIDVLPKIGGIAGILGLLFYVSAVVFTVLFKEYELEDEYFTRLDVTLLTLYQLMTMEAWATIVRQLMVHVYWAPLPIILFLIVSGFIFLNLIIALICEAMGEIPNIKEEMEAMKSNGISSNTSNRNPNIEWLEYIERCQRDINHILQNCTITPIDNNLQGLPPSGKGGVNNGTLESISLPQANNVRFRHSPPLRYQSALLRNEDVPEIVHDAES